MTILGIGAACIDINVFVSDGFLETYNLEKSSVLPIDISTLRFLLQMANGNPMITPGGSCGNVIRALSQLGWECSIIAKVGLDEEAKFLKRCHSEFKVNFISLTGKAPTAQILCLVTPDGERTMRDLLGASHEMRGRDLNSSYFKEKQLVHIDGYTLYNEDLTEEAMNLASSFPHTLISFDLGNYKIVEEYKKTLLRLIPKFVDIIFANEQEAFELLEQLPEEACRQLSTCCRYAAVTEGSKGCWVGYEGNVVHIPAISPKRFIDTTGAGDFFAAGFLDGVLRNFPIEKCGQKGTFLASQIIGYQGAFLSLEKWRELLSILQNR